MSDSNALTLQTYEDHLQEYIAASPLETSGRIKEWIDGNLKHLPKDARILEIGSGFGRDAAYIEKQGYTVERTDAVQSFIDFMNDNGQPASKLNILTDSLRDSYDMIFANGVLLHFTREEAVAVIAKVHAALKPGGRFVFSVKRGDDEETTDRKVHGPRYFCYWQPDAIEAVIFNVGFASIHDKIVEDMRGDDRPAWLYLSALKGNEE